MTLSTPCVMSKNNTIIGYRAWRKDINCPDLLLPLYAKPWMNPGYKAGAKMVASCHYRHKSPNSQCKCGIYAFQSFDDVINEIKNNTPWLDNVIIIGEVNLWGKIEIHKNGYRAEFAYPRNFAYLNFVYDFYREYYYSLYNAPSAYELREEIIQTYARLWGIDPLKLKLVVENDSFVARF